MWRSFAQTIQDCGRNATLFVVVVIVLAGLAFAGGEVCLWTAVGLLVAIALPVIAVALHPPAQCWAFVELPVLARRELRATHFDEFRGRISPSHPSNRVVSCVRKDYEPL